MKIILIGKDGQLGREIDKSAKLLGHDIISFSREDLDITDYKQVERKIIDNKPDVVINTAAYHVLQECEENFEKAFEINVFASKFMADVCKKMGIRLVAYSSDKVFDGTKESPYDETDPVNPLQIYGLSCLARENVMLNYNPESIIIRTCGIFGGLKGSVAKGGNFVLYILREAKTKEELEISEEYIASFVNAEDLSLATLKLLEAKDTRGIYHLVNEGYASWADFAKKIVKLSNLSLKIVPINRHGTYRGVRVPMFAPLRNNRAKKLGIELSSWQNGLERYVKFLSENQ